MTSILIECKVCKESVSKSALTCPHCGERLRMHPFTKFIVAVLGIVGVIPSNHCNYGNGLLFHG